MALRCSLLGHDFGDPEVDRERDKRGSEVVVTVREYETCARCGTQHVLTENTEVTSVAPGEEPGAADVADAPDAAAEEPAPAEPAADADPGDGPATDVDDADGTADGDAAVEADAADDAAAGEVDGDDAVVLDGTNPDGLPDGVEDDEPVAAPEAGGDPVDVDADHPTDESGEPITDDAEILDDEEVPDGERGHGEWPDSDDVGPPVGSEAEPSAWPDDEGEAGERDGEAGDRAAAGPPTAPDDGGEDAGGTDAVLIDAEAEGSGGSADATGGGDAAGSGIRRADAAPSPVDGPRSGDATDLACPNCGFVAPADRGSLRPGDICPECRKGYLSERGR